VLRRREVQRLFSAFPDGPPGVGLLLLRIVLGLTAVADGGWQLANHSDVTLMVWSMSGLVIMSAAALLIGVLTPVAGGTLGVSIALW
jgi:hypothetical protein